MNFAPLIFVGLFAAFSLSWFAYVLKPYADFGRQAPFQDKVTGAVYPMARPGNARQGAEVYREHGCASCHTQQVRAAQEGNDIARGWGARRTVAPDYMLDNPPLIGTIRLGPDLANVGTRRTDANWHYAHLYEPKSKVEGSIMPPYKYLFEERRARGGADAIPHPTKKELELVPNDDARTLVAYMMSLRANGLVFEAPMPQSKTNAPAGDTNAPAGGTNTMTAGTNAVAGETNPAASAARSTNAAAAATNSPGR